MKVLCLDIDGVLNSFPTAEAFGGYPLSLSQLRKLDRVAIGLIRRKCQQEVNIVLSSTWREHYPFELIGRTLRLPNIDQKPSLVAPCGQEIAEWLRAHPDVETWTIVDDDREMLECQLSDFVRTDHRDGLKWADYLDLCPILQINIGEAGWPG